MITRLSIPSPWSEAIDSWTLALRAAQRSAQTIETRTDHLRRFARQSGAGSPALVSRATLVEWAGAHEWSRETRRSVYASLRGFYRWALDTGVVVDDPTDALPSVRPAPPMPRPAPEAVYSAALEAADARARVILRLAAEAGLRRAEIAAVERRDLLEDLSGISLLVHGKGGKERIVPLSDSLAREVRRFIGRRRWLLPSPTGGHLTPRHVGKIATRLLPESWTLHTLRHRFASRAHAGSRDLIAIQRLLGHASVATTQRYIATDMETLRSAAAFAAV